MVVFISARAENIWGTYVPLAKYDCFIISPVEERFIGQKLYKRLSRFVSTLGPPEVD